jgi:hypothetical protein
MRNWLLASAPSPTAAPGVSDIEAVMLPERPAEKIKFV